jgi:hypothetical protein
VGTERPGEILSLDFSPGFDDVSHARQAAPVAGVGQIDVDLPEPLVFEQKTL